MYLRILILAFLFKPSIAKELAIPFVLLFALCWLLSRLSDKSDKLAAEPANGGQSLQNNKNPLEFKTALLFGVLFVLFAMITDFVMKVYGSGGVTSLAFVVGVTDIDPFLLNLLQHTGGISESTIALAIINATNSNNLLKMIYAISLSSRNITRKILLNYFILIFSGILVSILLVLL